MRAKRNYWGFAAMQQTRAARESGGRTWFGTLTLNPEWQGVFLAEARKRAKDASIDWTSREPVEYYCRRRRKTIQTTRLVCEEVYPQLCKLMLREIQLYWKRLRNDGHSFKYFVVFEPHKSGLPHAHFLLHELKGDKILKRELRERWPCGFFSAKLVDDSDKAAWYVVKYLSKHNQTRIRSSKDYVPELRAKPHSSEKNVEIV